MAACSATATTTAIIRTTLNGQTLSNWKVFYNDEENGKTYIILDDYLPNSAVNISGIQKYGTYNIYSNTSREHLIRALDTKANWQDIINNGKINGVDLSSDIKNDTENVWAMGSPTLEMWVDSWNTMYPEDKLYTAKKTGMSDAIGWGFYIGANENPTSYYVDLSSKQSYNNLLYYPDRSGYSNCLGYWLASPSAGHASYVMRVRYDGYVGNYYYDNDCYSARPLVCLPSNILE